MKPGSQVNKVYLKNYRSTYSYINKAEYGMKLEKAISIIKALSDGIDPFTGEQYPQDSPYQ